MSFSQKAGFVRHKTGVTVLGAVLLSSLMLTACGAPAAKVSDSQSQPSASASASAAPQGITKFTSDAFDLSKQVSVTIPNKDSYLRLSDGLVSRENSTITYTPYENEDSAWKYTPEISVGNNPNVRLMRWQDKSYIVIDGWAETSQPANGLQAAKNLTANNVIVLDAATGKTVNVFKDEPTEVGGNNMDRFYFNPRESDANNSETSIPFLTGLTYRTQNGSAKLVDPLTGKTVATEVTAGFMSLNNETGFYKNKVDFGSGRSTTKSVFGNFGFVVEYAPSPSGSSLPESTFSLVNTVTNETVSSMQCQGNGEGISTHSPVYSPNFRYVVFGNKYAFDTKTGKSFCSKPSGKQDARDFQISAVDNDGNMYGTADRDYLRVSLADISKVETLLKDVNTQDAVMFPIGITSKGSALFQSESSSDVLVAVPSKTPTQD